ncbi:MAG TPA: metalloregulator ArsR/SmtB family transcription factor, partial [Polyangiaceae bacterium]
MSHTSSVLKVSEAAPLFAALGDETRLKLVSRLCTEGPLSIVRLSEGTDVTRQAITKHLRALADAGLVHDTRQGRERIW